MQGGLGGEASADGTSGGKEVFQVEGVVLFGLGWW